MDDLQECQFTSKGFNLEYKGKKGTYVGQMFDDRANGYGHWHTDDMNIFGDW